MTTKIIVQFSGGKDSQACLINACEKYGTNRITAIFCDTGWEHELTYKHIQDTCAALGVKLIRLYNETAGGMENLCRRMRWFPDTQKRMCTVQLKIWPMIDWILAQDDHLIIIQGIRTKESEERAQMDEECMYFKEYFEEVKPGARRKKMYRKRDVLRWCKTHDASVLRPIFRWTGQEVINYILSRGQKPNPLYRRGAARVGCFPCIFSRLNEIKVVARDEKYRNRLVRLEEDVNAMREKGSEASFFPEGKIPARFCKTYGNGVPAFRDVADYVLREENQPSLFDDEKFMPNASCMSLYHGLCE